MALLAAVVVQVDASESVVRVSGEEAVVLAVDATAGEEGGRLPGPEPNLQNSFAPEEYEAPWTWWLGVVLTVVAVMITLGFGLAYYVLIHRPRQRIPQP